MTLATVLAALLVAPFLLVVFYIAADRFGWPMAGRALDMVVTTLKLQFAIGALVNIAVCVAMVGLAMWMVGYLGSAWRFPGAAVVLVFGLWRAWRGAAILWGFRDRWR